MRLFIRIFLTLFTLEAFAQEHTLQESRYKYVQQSIGKGKPYFLEVGSDSCYSCQVMGSMLYGVKQRHPEYNIHFINVKKERNAAYDLSVRMIPTQIIFDKDGKEVYRHIGALSDKELGGLLETYRF